MHHYDRNDKFLAKGHFDRGSYTIALAESAPGLRIGWDADSLKAVEQQKDHALFFPGIRLKEITSPEMKPAWHDVIQVSDNWNKKTARWAIVFFSDTQSPNRVTFEEAHQYLNIDSAN